jgi:hypothetical protein
MTRRSRLATRLSGRNPCGSEWSLQGDSMVFWKGRWVGC